MKVRLHEPTFGEAEIQAAVEVMRSTHVTQGKKVAEFEEACAETLGFERCVAVNSGSSANLLAVAAMAKRLDAGDEVAVPALSWPTTIWPIVQCGLTPVFVDCDLDTLNMGGVDTRAAMPVHVYGNPCNLDFKGWVVEDCCEAMGAPVGGALGTFSFYFSHHITTFEGGVIGTEDKYLADELRILRSHGWIRDCEFKDHYLSRYPDFDPKFLFVDQGYNLRMTEVAAAIGLVQLPKLQGIVGIRRQNHIELTNALSEFKYLRFQKMHPDSSCFSFAIILDNAPFTREALRLHLEAAGIETRPIIAGNMARQPGMQRFKHLVKGDLKNADKVMDYGFSIGNHQGIGALEIEYVHDTFRDFYETNA